MWWELVGSAVEHAAYMYQKDERRRKRSQEKPTRFQFKDQFISGETADETVNARIKVLMWLNAWRPKEQRFDARDVVTYFGNDADFIDALDKASNKPIENFTARNVAWRLKTIRDAPAVIGEEDKERGDKPITVMLRWQEVGANRNSPAQFWVEIIPE